MTRRPIPTAWFHARIVVAKGKVEVYVNRAATPSLVVDDLGEAKSGGVALWAGNGSDGAFANLSILQTSPPGPAPASRQTILQAAGTGNLARLKTLVEGEGVAVGERMPNGLTALHLAAVNDQTPAAEYLLSKGADINAVARHSGTPLDLVYESGNAETARWLESKGARVTPLRFDVVALTPAVHRVAFPWGMMNNVLVFSGTDGAVIVDSGFSTRAIDALRTTIARFSPSGVRYVVNSHTHGDHVAGNALAPSPAAVITAATLTAPPAGLAITPRAQPFKGRTGAPCRPDTRGAPAARTSRSFPGQVCTRTPTSSCTSRATVSSPWETCCCRRARRLSATSPATCRSWTTSLTCSRRRPLFVSGHGRDLDAAGVRAYRDALLEMVAIVRTNLAAGRTAEQMVKDNVLKGYKARYSLLDFLNPDTLIPRAVTALQSGALK